MWTLWWNEKGRILMFILFALAFFSRDGYCELSEIGEGCDLWVFTQNPHHIEAFKSYFGSEKKLKEVNKDGNLNDKPNTESKWFRIFFSYSSFSELQVQQMSWKQLIP